MQLFKVKCILNLVVWETSISIKMYLKVDCVEDIYLNINVS